MPEKPQENADGASRLTPRFSADNTTTIIHEIYIIGKHTFDRKSKLGAEQGRGHVYAPDCKHSVNGQGDRTAKLITLDILV